MSRSSSYVPLLLTGMIITGSTNSLWLKWQDMQCIENCGDPDLRNHVLYQQPVLQTVQMFFGQILCSLPVLYAWLSARRNSGPISLPTEANPDDQLQAKLASPSREIRGWKLLLLWPPAILDLAGATLLHVGLLYAPLSIYQMTRGTLVLFVGILTVIFLRRHLSLYQWISLFIVMAGVSLVGYSGSLIKNIKDTMDLVTVYPTGTPPDFLDQVSGTKVLVGLFFVLLAQVFLAAQNVLEEKIMSCWSIQPLAVASLEGLFGVLTVLLLAPFMMQPSMTSRFPYFDLTRGWSQMVTHPSVLWSGIAVAFSISLYNYFCLSVTKYVNATTRSLMDICRTLSIWLVSLALGWERLLFPISLLQVLGFSGMVYGTLSFNSIVRPLFFFRPPLAVTALTTGEEGTEAARPHRADEEGR